MTTHNDGVTCCWPRCRSTRICCAVPHPHGLGEPLALCDDHFERWHDTQDAKAREALVTRLWRGRMTRRE